MLNCFKTQPRKPLSINNQFTFHKFSQLHRVHEGFFDAAVEDYPGEEDAQSHHYTDEDVDRFNGTYSEESTSETFNDRNHRIKHVKDAVLLGNLSQGIDHRGNVHPELDRESHCKSKIAVFCD